MSLKSSHDRILPFAPVERLLREKAKRIGESAIVQMVITLEDIGLEIAERAVQLAEHAKRVTITDDDIKLAFKEWRKRAWNQR